MKPKDWRDEYGLTLKQGSIVHELIKGLARKIIASNLDIPISSIDSYFKAIYLITDTKGHVALAKWGKERNY